MMAPPPPSGGRATGKFRWKRKEKFKTAIGLDLLRVGFNTLKKKPCNRKTSMLFSLQHLPFFRKILLFGDFTFLQQTGKRSTRLILFTNQFIKFIKKHPPQKLRNPYLNILQFWFISALTSHSSIPTKTLTPHRSPTHPQHLTQSLLHNGLTQCPLHFL